MAATRTHGPRDTARARQARREARLGRIEDTHILATRGLDEYQIAHRMELAPGTIRRYLREEAPLCAT